MEIRQRARLGIEQGGRELRLRRRVEVAVAQPQAARRGKRGDQDQGGEIEARSGFGDSHLRIIAIVHDRRLSVLMDCPVIPTKAGLLLLVIPAKAGIQCLCFFKA